ncbi:DNA cytosine methyltransferase [Pantoea sp. MQR6]|uniref:DNA cytosine methyltransferase n=1 Tax=Pantoea sp. MQR6 TaxID=2907307 RepID=UPI001FAA2178|nr:DNA cytosine methyltransferase [Pantoea sp. MQR6]
MSKKITYVDLFSGCGGLSWGFYNSPDFKGLLASDVWKEAKKNYDLNHKDVDFYVKDFSDPSDTQSIINLVKDKCDIVIGGPPCQGFSTLGKRELNCEKSILVDSFLDAAIAINPRFIIMENVKAIRSKKHPDGGHFIDVINNKLTQAGFAYETIILNALDFGLGQTRERFFLFACKVDESELLAEYLDAIAAQKVDSFSTLYELIGDLPKVGPGEEYVDKNGVIFNHKAMKHGEKLVERFEHVPKNGGLLDVPRHLLTDHLINMIDGKYGSGGHAKNIYGRMDWNAPSGTIVAGMDKITAGRFLHPVEHRLLTPRECARIQSFPDSFVFEGSLVTQYYLIGNAVPPVFSEVLSKAYKQVFGN